MGYSESFWISIAAAGSGVAAICLWYFRSIMLTSRCDSIECCCGLMKVHSQILKDSTVLEINQNETPPPQLSITGQIQSPPINVPRRGSVGSNLSPAARVSLYRSRNDLDRVRNMDTD